MSKIHRKYSHIQLATNYLNIKQYTITKGMGCNIGCVVRWSFWRFALLVLILCEDRILPLWACASQPYNLFSNKDTIYWRSLNSLSGIDSWSLCILILIDTNYIYIYINYSNRLYIINTPMIHRIHIMKKLVQIYFDQSFSSLFHLNMKIKLVISFYNAKRKNIFNNY